MSQPDPFLRPVEPMGIYRTLYSFFDAFGTKMGEPGTHPWAQGFPLTTQLPGGPELPGSVEVTAMDRRYPNAWGLPALREAIAAYYRREYGAGITAENVMVFAGGRPGILATLLFLADDITVRVAETEYTPYYDMLEALRRRYELVGSGVANGFVPAVADYVAPPRDGGRTLVLVSNPCNPTGCTYTGDSLAKLVAATRSPTLGMLIDEAYELFHSPPVSALAHVEDIEDTNLLVAAAATKGFQAPGIRIGWVIGARRHIQVLGNFSSFGMGGVSHPSQRYALELFGEERVAIARKAVPQYYDEQRDRYGEALAAFGVELYTGNGGFYHWCRLPGGLRAADLNRRLFQHGAAILEGTDCDMARRGTDSPHQSFFRFSFGPLSRESFAGDVEILRQALGSA